MKNQNRWNGFDSLRELLAKFKSAPSKGAGVNGSKEYEVFRSLQFDTNKYYEFAIKTRTEGNYPNQKYYTTNEPKYLGKYVKSEEWGWGDGRGGAEYFVDNGVINRIEYDYCGNTCFREVQTKKLFR